MAWTGFVLTVDGRNALNQAQVSNTMNIKSIVVGDGNAPGNFSTLKGLVHQLFEITNLKIDLMDGKCILTADFPKVDYDYYYRELGVIVTTDDGDKLYVYDNCGDDAQHIVCSTGVESTQKRIRISLYITDVADITVSNPSILYVGYDDYEQTVGRLEEAIDAAKEEAAGALEAHAQDTGNPHKVSREQLQVDKTDNTADIDKPVSAPQQAALDGLYEQLAAYTRQEIANLINGAPSNLDTLKEVSDAIAAHKTIMDALDAAIGKKASAAEFDSHTKDTTKHITPTERTNWNDANTKKHTHGNKSVLDGITSTLISGWSAKMEKTGDSANNTVTFSSGDATNPTGWADIGVVASGEKHSSLWRKFSLAVKNIRYLYNLLTSGALSTLLGTNLTANRAVVANGNGKLAAAGVTATELGYLAGVKSKVQDQLNELNTGIENMSDSLGGHKVGFTTQCYTASTTMTTLLKNLTAPIMCLLSTENVSDKPTGKYGTIVIFKYSASRAGAICLCTDGTMFVNNWNASTSAVTGWMEK